MTDAELLEQYRRGSGDAFAQLAGRHVNWVYGLVRRQVHDGHLAEEVTQAVFTVLAQKGPRLRGEPSLSAWLFTVAHLSCKQALREEQRRRQRETQAARLRMQSHEPQSFESGQLAAMLDELIGRLKQSDRRAVLLRFYEQKSFPEIGQAMQISEEAARKRVDRALQKLRGILSAQGATVPAATLTAVLLAEAAQPAPVGLAVPIPAAAPPSALAQAVLAAMSVKMKLAAAAALAALLVVSGGAAATLIVLLQTAGGRQVSLASAAPPATLPAAAGMPATNPGDEALARGLLARYQRSLDALTRIHYRYHRESTREGDWNWAVVPPGKARATGEFWSEGARLRDSCRLEQYRKDVGRVDWVMDSRTVMGPDGLDPATILYRQSDPWERPQDRHVLVVSPTERWAYYCSGGLAELRGLSHEARQPISITMSQAPKLWAHPRMQPVDGHQTHLVEAQTRYGRYRLWLDPQAGYLPRRIELHKSADDLYGNEPLGKTFPVPMPQDGVLDCPNVARASWDSVVDVVEIVHIGKDFVPTRASTTITTHYVDGQVTVARAQEAREDIDLDPDFAAQRAFTMDVPNGTPVIYMNNQGRRAPKFEWVDGRIVPAPR